MWLTIVAISAVIFAGYLLLQVPRIQTCIADKAVSSLSEKLDGYLEIGKFHLKPFTTLILKDVVIIDKNPSTDPTDSCKAAIDTFFRAGYIVVDFTLKGLTDKESIKIDKVYISNAQMNLVLENGADIHDRDQNTESLSRIFRIKKKKEKRTTPRNPKEIFRIRDIEIRDMGFALINNKLQKTPYHGGIDWNDLCVSDINLNAEGMRFKNGVMYGILEGLSFREKSGFVCRNISGSTEVGNGLTLIRDLKITDRWSDLSLEQYSMSYDWAKDFADFIEKVRIGAVISPGILDFRTLAYFVPQLKDNNLKLEIRGKADGFVNDFTVNGLAFRSVRGGFSGKLNGRIKGLPDITGTTMDIDARNFHVTTTGLGDFVSSWMKDGKRLDLSRFAKGSIFMIDASAEGSFNDMGIGASISSMIGKAEGRIRISELISKDDRLRIKGELETADLDIGRIIGTEMIRQTSLKTGIDATFGGGSPEVDIDSLLIDRLHLNGYDYSTIAAAGELKQNSFDGRIVCNDPNLSFLFQGRFALSAKTNNAIYKFYANIGDADLNKLNIDRRGPSKVRLTTTADFTKTGGGDLLGNVKVNDLVLENSIGKHAIGDISIVTSQTNENDWTIMLKSDFADGKYSGTAPVGRFISDLKDITLRKEIPALFKDKGEQWNRNEYRIDFNCHNSMDLMAFAAPGLYIADSTSFNLEIDRQGQMKASLKSPRIAFKEQFLKGMDAVLNNSSDKMTGEIFCNEIQAASLKTSNNRLLILADDNRVGAGFSYDNNTEPVNRGELVCRGDFSRNEDNILNMDIELLPTTLHLNSREWNIMPSDLNISGKDINVRRFELRSAEQRIKIEGGTSSTARDTLTLTLDRFDVSIVNSLLKKNLDITGAATGKVQLTSPLSDKGLLADIICDSTYIAGVPLGVLSVGSRWDEDFDRFGIGLKNDYNGKSNISVSGFYTPKNRSLEAKAELSGLQIGYVQPFLSDVFSQMQGSISGDIFIDGPVDNIDISSENGRLDDAMLKIAYTNVPYVASGLFHIDSKGVYFDDIDVKDSHDGTGEIGGSINWDHFRNMYFDLMAKVTNMECVNLTAKQGDIFYGNLFATGNLAITGDIKDLTLQIDAVTSRPGQLHIPLSNAIGTGARTNLLKFKEKEESTYIDPYELMMARLTKKESTGGNLGMKMRVTASQDVEAFLELDKDSGNMISGRGNGTIDLEVDKDIFEINGDYTLRSGNCRFNAMGLATRDFEIQDGSSIRFGGDIMESTLDINAVYRTKASLSTLISDTTSVSNKRYIDCGISITDRLSNPRLKFSIQIPDLDPMIKSRVESALSTEDKVQRQFLSLLISNNFIPDDQSGIVNNSTVLYSSVSEILANQINNIFQKLDIPLDLGLNYQPNERGNDIFDVAVSTQLFNNRVTVNGNIGNRQYSSGNSQNDIVGDIDIEIKLDRSGAIRLTLFSHSADQYTNSLDNSQRNGVGLTYQTEFNTFRQFFRNMFSSRKKRIQAKLAEEEAMINEGKVTIEIENSSTENGRKRKTIPDTLSVRRK